MSLLLLLRGAKDTGAGAVVTPQLGGGYSDGPDTPRFEPFKEAELDIASIIRANPVQKVAPPIRVRFKPKPVPPIEKPLFTKTEKAKLAEQKLEELKDRAREAIEEEKKRKAKESLPIVVKKKKLPPKPEKKSPFYHIETPEEKLQRLMLEAEASRVDISDLIGPQRIDLGVMPRLLSLPKQSLATAYPQGYQDPLPDDKLLEVLSQLDTAQSDLEAVIALSEL